MTVSNSCIFMFSLIVCLFLNPLFYACFCLDVEKVSLRLEYIFYSVSKNCHVLMKEEHLSMKLILDHNDFDVVSKCESFTS